MLAKMIEDALNTEREAAGRIAQAQKETSDKEHAFDDQSASQLKEVEAAARASLRETLETARKEHAATIESATTAARQECGSFLEKNEEAVRTATTGVCQILSTPIYQSEGGK